VELVAAAHRACLALGLTTLAADDGVPSAPAHRS
jgi:hypothetical protein